MSEIKICDACGESVTCAGHRDFGQNHRCKLAGSRAESANYKVCPQHGTLIWVVGPYSAFRACATRNCTAGKNGKPHRYCAPRGANRKGEMYANVDPTDVIDVDQPEIPGAQPSPSPSPITPALKDTKMAKTTLNLKQLGSLGDSIAEYVEQRAHEIASEVTAAAVDRVAAQGPRVIEWRVNGEVFAKIDGTSHKALPRMLKLYKAGFRNFLIVGPAGSGKTTLARDMAKALSLSFGSVSCTAGMSESALTGRAIPNLTTGETSYQSTDFVRAYEGGGVFLIDEVDAADPNVMLAINSALANGHMPLPNRADNPSAARHTAMAIVAAANTWGTGADRQYVGRNQLDAAFLDRFVGSTISVDYDRDLESAITGDAHICARVWTMRDKVQELKLRRVVGTRFLMSVMLLVKGAGETVDQAIRACCEGWTSDEMSKVGVR